MRIATFHVNVNSIYVNILIIIWKQIRKPIIAKLTDACCKNAGYQQHGYS